MVKFLINKPIAVTMTFIALLVLGIIASMRLPVSLMPDVDIPKITVQVSAENLSARELENAIVSQFRLQLLQVSHLADIKSETRDGSAVIKLDFDYGTNIDFAFIEVNEKIDRGMAGLPMTVERPRIIKASATDIPVFYLNLTLRNEKNKGRSKDELFPVSQEFSDLSSFAGQVIRKRIEQLPEVAIADISGQVFSEILILPDMDKLEGLDISIPDIENTLKENHVSLGNLLIQDGQYQYNVRFGNEIQTKKDIADLYLKNSNRLLQLRDVATIVQHPQNRKGMVVSDGKDAVTLAIIKQSDARMSDLKKELGRLMELLRIDYPGIEFTITRDQTQLLDFSIRNLSQSLYLGAFLAFIVMFLFLKNYKSPWLIGITIPAAMIISLLFFLVFGLTLNVVSLAGLVLGISIMTDNSIVVIDNIAQHHERGSNLEMACINGTNEVIRPMLSAVLTTCAVYIPLIFISGITGALFYDQAIAITISQFASLMIGITVLPVYYLLLYRNGKQGELRGILLRINSLNYEKLYGKGFRFVMRHQVFTTIAVFLMLAGAVGLFMDLHKDKLPPIVKNETVLRIDWNERININENNRRTQMITGQIQHHLEHNTCIIGEQQFLLDHNTPKSGSEALVYLKTRNAAGLDTVFRRIEILMKIDYPNAGYSFEDAGNIFDQLFGDNEPTLLLRLRATADFGPEQNIFLQQSVEKLQRSLPDLTLSSPAWQEQMVLRADAALLTLYGITYEQVFAALKRAFRENEILTIAGNENFVPVILGEKPRYIRDAISRLTVLNKENQKIPVNSLLKEETGFDLKTIIAGQEGEYFPIAVDVPGRDVAETQKTVRKTLAEDSRFEAGFTGSYFSNRSMLKQLVVIFAISLVLLYFILASQFESLTLPLIVLLEIPVDLFGAFLFLKIFGGGINLMSMIGIVVMSGVVINDSILKVDTFNKLMKEGYPLMKALMVGGQRRLKPIVMTALTAILALLPLLFFGGMGTDLQKPMALTIIGGMIVGTFISLYVVPLGYYYLKK